MHYIWIIFDVISILRFLDFSDIWFIVIVDCLIRWTSDDTRQTDDRQTTHDDIANVNVSSRSLKTQ